MNKKHIIIFSSVVALLVAVGIGANALVIANCNYDTATGNYIYQGEEYAHGTMGSALECALAGLLPKLVSDRLGVYGDAPTKEQARKIIETNKINKERANE
jgi:hypothetical protein